MDDLKVVSVPLEPDVVVLIADNESSMHDCPYDVCLDST